MSGRSGATTASHFGLLVYLWPWREGAAECILLPNGARPDGKLELFRDLNHEIAHSVGQAQLAGTQTQQLCSVPNSQSVDHQGRIAGLTKDTAKVTASN